MRDTIQSLKFTKDTAHKQQRTMNRTSGDVVVKSNMRYLRTTGEASAQPAHKSMPRNRAYAAQEAAIKTKCQVINTRRPGSEGALITRKHRLRIRTSNERNNPKTEIHAISATNSGKKHTSEYSVYEGQNLAPSK